MDTNAYKASLKDMTVLVTGGTGSIGSAVVRHFLSRGARVRVFSRNESRQHDLKSSLQPILKRRTEFMLGDVRDPLHCQRATHGVDAVVHTAAVKHVTFAASDPGYTAEVNIGGTENMLQAAAEARGYILGGSQRFLLVSTDKAAGPISIMGMTKRIAEQIVMTSSYDDSVRMGAVRFGNIWRSNGSVIPTWLDAMQAERTCYIVDKDVTRYVITAENAAKLIEHALLHHTRTGQDVGRSVFVPSMPAMTVQQMWNMALKYADRTGYNKVEEIKLSPGEHRHERLIGPDEVRHISCQGKARDVGYYVELDHLKTYTETEDSEDAAMVDQMQSSELCVTTDPALILG